MSDTEDSCHRDNPAFPCSLVYCWLCSCFPSRSGAPDDGRPRYGLCSSSTLFSVFSCSVAAFKPSLQSMSWCLEVMWLQMKSMAFFFHIFWGFICFLLVGCWFAPVTLVSLHPLHYNICKWIRHRNCDWNLHLEEYKGRLCAVKESQEQSGANVWKHQSKLLQQDSIFHPCMAVWDCADNFAFGFQSVDCSIPCNLYFSTCGHWDPPFM